MKQVVVTGPKEFEVQEVAVPKVGKKDVLIQMKAAGVCGSDIHLYLGENPKVTFPRIPGHENIGVVTEVGEAVKEISVGDHVVIDLVVACKNCPQCRAGRFNVCENVKARGASTDGGWREFVAVPEDEVHVIDANIPFEAGVLVEPFAIGQHCTKRAGVKAEDTVLIFGSGTIGMTILQACKQIGTHVICADINQKSLERAKKMGADSVIDSKNENLVEAIQKLTDGHGVDVVFDAACFSGSLALLLAEGILKNGGTIVPLGFCTDFEKISQAMINGRELSIIGSRMSTGQFKPTIKELEEDAFILDDLVSHYIPFSKIHEVFENIENPSEDLTKMVILFE